MTEEKLCKAIYSALFAGGSCELGKWFNITIKDKETGKQARLDALVPARGNIKVRIPRRRISNNVVEFQISRITKYNTLHTMGYAEDKIDVNMPRLSIEV